MLVKVRDLLNRVNNSKNVNVYKIAKIKDNLVHTVSIVPRNCWCGTAGSVPLLVRNSRQCSTAGAEQQAVFHCWCGTAGSVPLLVRNSRQCSTAGAEQQAVFHCWCGTAGSVPLLVRNSRQCSTAGAEQQAVFHCWCGTAGSVPLLVRNSRQCSTAGAEQQAVFHCWCGTAGSVPNKAFVSIIQAVCGLGRVSGYRHNIAHRHERAIVSQTKGNVWLKISCDEKFNGRPFVANPQNI